MSAAKYSKSNRGNHDILYYEGFTYYSDSKTDERTFLLQRVSNQYVNNGNSTLIYFDARTTCFHFHHRYNNDNHCLARAITLNDNKTVVANSGKHNHAGNASDYEVKSIINETKEIARAEPRKKTSEIVKAAQEKCSSAAILAELPPEKQFMRILNRTRNPDNEIPPNPGSIEELDITDDMKQIEYGGNDDDDLDVKIEEFLYFDSGPTNKRVLIFATAHNLSYLKQCEFWHLDGTFDSAPEFFQHLFIIHGEAKPKE